MITYLLKLLYHHISVGKIHSTVKFSLRDQLLEEYPLMNLSVGVYSLEHSGSPTWVQGDCFPGHVNTLLLV